MSLRRGVAGETAGGAGVRYEAKSRRMDRKGEQPRPRKATITHGPTDELFDELRRIYEQYGAGEIPRHILELARELEDALERDLTSRGRGSEAASRGAPDPGMKSGE